MADTAPNPSRDSEPGAPRWVKVFGLVTAVLIVAFVALHLAGGGFRGHGSP